MSENKNNNNLNKKEDNKSKITPNNSNNDSVEQMSSSTGEVDSDSDMTAEREMIENNLRQTMDALNIKSNDSIDIEIISPHEKIFPKKVTKYKVIKHYIKGEKLGKGSFATVREFVDQKTLKRVAGKIIKKSVLKTIKTPEHIKQNIEKEFKLVHKLDHINVIKIFDKHETAKKIYLFMEYGIAVLEEFLAEAPDHRLPQWQCHRYFTHIIEGLDYLHSKGVIHRDIKPDNLIVDTSDVIKICDFGVCHIIDWFAPNDHLEKVEGTYQYQPPEAFDAHIKHYSGTKFDIWSSGVTLYRMISGKLPFKNEQSIRSAKINYANQITGDIDLWYLLKGVLNRDFNKRFAITDIKKHRWYVRHDPKNCKPVSVPVMRFGDIYRSMTVLPRLESHYYHKHASPEQLPSTDELVTEEEDMKLRDPKYRISPTIRSSRKMKKDRSPHNPNPAVRVLFAFL